MTEVGPTEAGPQYLVLSLSLSVCVCVCVCVLANL